MTDLSFYVSAIKANRNVICLEKDNETDRLAEIEKTTEIWRHESGVVVQYSRETESVSVLNDNLANVCPECWISWEILDAAGQHIRPAKKHFHNACQESFWLKMHK
ncbi:TPA: hypothetical protein ACIPUI_000437 [Citrobacter freundii]